MFESNTSAGRAFDIILICMIVASVLVVMLDSLSSLPARWTRILVVLEWGFTLLFLIEYLLRLFCARYPLRYATGFFGIVDFMAVLPSFMGLLVAGTSSLLVVRMLRLVRLFRVLKMTAMTEQAGIILDALRSSRHKIQVFLFAVLILTILFGAFMYLFEGESNPGFDNIPRSVYWCIVTITTVGYGDISPKTPAGQFLAAILMLMGYSIIAVPTGIVTSEWMKGRRTVLGSSHRTCPRCEREGHDADAVFCKSCGERLNSRKE